ncbi:MAG: hypothetical protein ACK40L_12395, partial [Hydrogenophaga sp.]
CLAMHDGHEDAELGYALLDAEGHEAERHSIMPLLHDRNGGTRPIVVSYASSPAAEVFYSKEKLTASPTANLFLKGGVFRQVEGVALVRGGNPAARGAAGQFIEFLRSAPAQQALQTSMWMYPAEPGVPLAEVMQQHAVAPQTYDNPPTALMQEKGRAWVQRWTRTVLR